MVAGRCDDGERLQRAALVHQKMRADVVDATRS
jgi:hypothetical protein